jgi:ABC-type transport system involved in cytochrome bd biosynthesis fused ATPase/permease subunit
MDTLQQAIDSQTVLVIAAVAVALLALRLLFRVLNVGLGTILTIVAIVLILQYGFGISPRELWFEIGQLPQEIMRFAKNLG